VYFLVPRFLLKKSYLVYFVLVSALILLVIGITIITQTGLPLHAGSATEPSVNRFRPPSMDAPMRKPPFMIFFDNLIISILIVGAGTTIKLMTKWLNEEKLRIDVEKEHLKTNLALLRHQVSPHFFMNTLNNIHTLVEIDAEKAQDAIERLSTLMRYLLYDSSQNTIELKKEIEFIKSFVSLMQLRHSDEVEVTVIVPTQIPDTKIPPMLFISLLENAFKHGISYPLKSYIHFELQLNNTSLNCTIKNSKHKIAPKQQGEYSGIGLDNIKESLKLLYGSEFQLNILDKENEFEVDLKIPI
jgi:LytS/YehU family sensor histidine kinase